MIISDYGRHMLLPGDKAADFNRPAPYISKSIGHHREWLEAIKTGGATTCNFDYLGALTEAVLLGVVFCRGREPLQWDAKNLKVSNLPRVQQLIHEEHRRGWTL